MHKKIIIAVILLTVVLGAAFFINRNYMESGSIYEGEDGTSATPVYGGGLFDEDRVHTIDIRIADEDWENLLEQSADKTKYKTDVIIDGETIEQVSFSTKGNSSLSFVANFYDNDRYSFKLNFRKYVKDQTWHGLDELNLLNMFSDATCMKDYLSYDLFRKAGIPAPLTAYVWVTINGKDHGLYLAAEGVSKSFVARTHRGKGALYKPENSNLALDEEVLQSAMETGSFVKGGANGADLVYTDDLPEHYSDIFDNAVTGDSERNRKRVIQALKKLSQRKGLQNCLNTSEIIGYFAVHNYLGNYDSYTGPMLHNYYLYEYKGTLAMIPWDYNLIFGRFPMNGQIGHDNDISLVVNQGIDSPLAGTTESERPMWSWIVSNEKYLKEYHQALSKLIKDNFDSGEFARKADKVYEMIAPYVEKDPTAFYTPEEVNKAVQTIKEFSMRRAESIRRQLDGQLSSVTDQQSLQDRVDTSGISISDMGFTIFP